MLIVIAILLLVLVFGAHLSYRFSFADTLVPVGYESYQEPATASEQYVTASPGSQYSGNPPYFKRPGKYIYLTNNADAQNVNFEALKAFIASDQTDRDLYIPGTRMCGSFAETLHNNAEQAGIRAALVILEFWDDSASHALNAFETTDRGLVYVDCTGAIKRPVDFEEWLYNLLYARGQDRIAYVVKDKEYGTIPLEDAESTQYSYYMGYSKSLISGRYFFFEQPGTVKSIAIYW